MAEDVSRGVSVEETDERRPKRKRIGYSCDLCRTKKNRCDGDRPVCGPCKQRQRECVYSPQRSRAGVTQEYVHNLEARNKELEQQIAANGPNGLAIPPIAYRGSDPSLPPETTVVSVTGVSTPLEEGLFCSEVQRHGCAPYTTATPAQNPTSQGQHMINEEDATRNQSTAGLRQKTMFEKVPTSSLQSPGVLDPISVGKHRPTEYFGESSAFDFMAKVYSPENEANRDPTSGLGHGQRHSPAAPSLATSSPAGPIFDNVLLHTGTDDPFSLPHRFVADKLVDAYFNYRHPLNFYLHEVSFRERYRRLWLSDGLGGEEASARNLAWLGLVNVVFAFGNDHMHVTSRPSLDRSRFFKRAKTLVLSGLLQAGSIELVQALLLMGQYLHGSLELNNCWTVVGLAIRTAQGLGLHLDETSFTSDVVDQELRKRVWWECFIIDRIVSMKVGRPPTIHDGPAIKVGLPLAVDDEYLVSNLAGQPLQPPGVPSKVDFLNHVIPQCRLLERICETLYSDGYSRGQAETPKKRSTDLSKLLALSVQLEGELLAWEQALPPQLSFQSEVKGWVFERQRSVLLMRFLHCRLLTHRQILLVYLTRRITNSFLCEIMHCCVRGGVIAAYDTINQMCILRQQRLLHSWWHNSHYVFAALGVLLVFQTLDPPRQADVALPVSIDVEQAILRGIECLEDVGAQMHPLASQYVQSFRQLQTRLRALFSGNSRPVETRSVPAGSDRPCTQGNPTDIGIPLLGNSSTAHTSMYDGSGDSSIFLSDEIFNIESLLYDKGWAGMVHEWDDSLA